MMKEEERFYLAALTQCPGLGCQRLKHLLQKEPSAVKLWTMSASELLERKLLPESLAHKLVSFCQSQAAYPEKLARACEESDIQLCSILDASYPKPLDKIHNAPALLFYKGTLVPDAARLAVVGARRKTPYGDGIAKHFAEVFARAGLTVVSGAARGIDTCAHLGALKSGRTVAVLGCGLDIVYPPENNRLLSLIIEAGGAVLSEYVPGTPPYATNFPARNRIISGLSMGTLVVEAKKHSGSLITAKMALNENRDVFAIPGTIYAKTSEGCNQLIQQSEAKLMQSPEEILAEFGFAAPKAAPPKPKVQLTEEEKPVYQVLSGRQALTMDELLVKLPQMDIQALTLILLHLKMKGLIIENDSCAYRRTEGE